MKIAMWVNGVHRDLEVPPLKRLLDVLREDLGLIGAKEGCGEGECGACAVILDGRLVNSCLLPAYRAHGRVVRTIEGLGTPEHPDPVQSAFVAEGAVQCGYCIPGLVMASRALLDEEAAPSRPRIREALAGNLCRCTGYERVVRAVERAALSPARACGTEPSPNPAADLEASPGDEVVVHVPGSLRAACEALARGGVTVVGGATDLGVLMHEQIVAPRVVLDLSRVAELHGVRREGGALVIGAATPYADLLRDADVARDLPCLHAAVRSVGAPAIQSLGTLGGNLANGSPGADAVPPLLALGARLRLASVAGEREVAADAFFTGYRATVRRDDELVAAIVVPLPAAGTRQSFRKAGTRRAQAIAKVNLAACARVEGGVLCGVRLAAGSVGPTVILLRRTMALLEGGPAADLDRLAEAAAAAANDEVAPIDDVRSTATYRRDVTGNLVKRFVASLCEMHTR
ncbi:MAG: FAD binding domain-containing protein [bacterium]|nr:FAD binding domain-containing protein [bacterium]